MSKFHINKHGVPAPCKATKGNCPLGGEERHFDSQEAAQEYADKVNAEEHGVLPGINSNNSRTITHTDTEIVEALALSYLQETKNENEQEPILIKPIGIRKFDEIGSEENLRIVVEDFKEEIKMQQEDVENNYGLLFYRHGYNGRAQSETRNFYRDEYGIDVF